MALDATLMVADPAQNLSKLMCFFNQIKSFDGIQVQLRGCIWPKKAHCLACVQVNWIAFDQTKKYVDNCKY